MITWCTTEAFDEVTPDAQSGNHGYAGCGIEESHFQPDSRPKRTDSFILDLFELLAKVPDRVKGVADFLVQRVPFLPFSILVEIDDPFAQICIPDVFRFNIVEQFTLMIGVGKFARFSEPAFEFVTVLIELGQPFAVAVDIIIAQKPSLHC